MFHQTRMCRWLFAVLLAFPLLSTASIPAKSMVVFGDSLSDIGNTTHLLRSLRQEDNPAFIVAPFKLFVINKMIDFANDYYVPQVVLDAGLGIVTEFFDHELAPYIVNLVNKVRLVPILPGKPYWNDRFSNGPVWNEYLADMWSVPKSDAAYYENFAFGGSWAATYDYQLSVWNLIRHPLGTIKSLIVGKLIPPSLGLVVQGYLMEHKELNDEAVYFVAVGGNDYLNVLLFEDNYNSDVMSKYVDNVVDSIGSAVKKLSESGARKFVVFGVPHIGNIPKFVNTNDREVLNAASDLHNERLQARIEEWKASYPDADFLFINTQMFLSNSFEHPEHYGFTHVADACIDVTFPMYRAYANSPFAGNFVLQYAQVLQHKDSQLGISKNYHMCDAPDGYLFWDEVHPSTRAHHHFAYEICLAMKDHGYDVSCKSPNPA